jgi:hypothetical protein
MSRPGKHPNSGVCWFRKGVREDLRSLVGKRDGKRSLQTHPVDFCIALAGDHLGTAMMRRCRPDRSRTVPILSLSPGIVSQAGGSTMRVRGVHKSQWIVRMCMVRSPHVKKRLEDLSLPDHCAVFRIAYASGSPLSVGFAITRFSAVLIGILRLIPFGGIGLRRCCCNAVLASLPRQKRESSVSVCLTSHWVHCSLSLCESTTKADRFRP